MHLGGEPVAGERQRRDNAMRSETVMTKALQDAFKEAEKLSDDEQERLAAAIHAEIDAEAVWASSSQLRAAR